MKKLIKIFIFIVGFLFLGIFSLFIFFKTEFAQDKLKALVSSQTIFSYEKIEGALPFSVTLTDVKVSLDEQVIFIKTLKARPSLFAIFRNTIQLHDLTVSDVTITPQATNAAEGESLTSLPYSLKVSKYQVNNLMLDGSSFTLTGKAKLSSNLKAYSISSHVTRDSYEKSFIDFSLKKKRQLRPVFSSKITSENGTFLDTFTTLSPSINGTLSISGKGEKDLLNDLLEGKIPKTTAIGKGEVNDDETPYSLSFTVKTPFLNFENVVISSPMFTLKAHFSMKEDYTIGKSPFTLDLTLLEGHFINEGSFTYNQFLSAEFTSRASSFTLDEFILKNFEAKGSLTYQEDLKAKINGSFDTLDSHFHLKSDIASDNKAYHFSSLEIQSPYITAKGNLTLLENSELLGKIEGDFTSLSFIKKYLPGISDIGRGTFRALFKEDENVHINTKINNFHYHDFQVSSATASLDSIDYSFEYLNNLSIVVQDASHQHLKLNTITFTTSTTEENWPFSLDINGYLTESIEINSNGFWRYSNDNLSINIQELTGSLLTHPFVSSEPIDLQWTKDQLFLTDLQIDLIDSSLSAKADMTETSGSLKTSINNFPVEFLLLLSPYYDLTGRFSLEANLDNNDGKLTGTISTDFNNLSLPSLPDDLKVDGKVSAQYKDSLLDLKTNFTIGDKPYLTASGKVPIDIDPVLLTSKIEKEAPLSGNISFSGNIEDILDLFDLGPHTFSGKLKADFTTTGTFSYPKIQGRGYFSEGFYENAYTGTRLQEVTAMIKADKNTLNLESLSAKGPKGGFLNASGAIDLDHGDFPFLFNLEFNKLRAVEIGYFDAEGKGKITIEGNKDGALAHGQVKVKDGNFTIAEKLPTSIPDLPITYLHAPPSFDKQKATISSPSSYPFNLDITIDAPNNISITGRGVDSEWKGSFQIKGNIDQPTTAGSIELLRGSYYFSGKEFTLSEGRLTFPEKVEASPTLYLTGKISEQNTTIIVNLNGPLTNPKLTFSSIPSLSTASILSLLLFGQDISEINGPQAIQLAAVVASFSGDGPDILESTRKSLGIDRLTLVTVPTKEDMEALQIQVGKYISKGVLVKVTQGFGADQTSVGVAVDLGRGFVFEAETQQKLEQGRFTLKWNVTY